MVEGRGELSAGEGVREQLGVGVGDERDAGLGDGAVEGGEGVLVRKDYGENYLSVVVNDGINYSYVLEFSE